MILCQFPAVTSSYLVFGAVEKNVHEVEVKPLTILKISIKSALLRRSCKDHNPADQVLHTADLLTWEDA